MVENNQPKEKVKWWKKLLKVMIKSPINSIFVISVIYCVVQAFVFSPTFYNKVLLFAVVCLWVFWFLAKQIFIVLILLGLLCSGGYLYYEYTHKEIRECEEAGRYWNSETKTCEENVPFMEKAKRFIKSFVIDIKTTKSDTKKVSDSEDKK